MFLIEPADNENRNKNFSKKSKLISNGITHFGNRQWPIKKAIEV